MDKVREALEHLTGDGDGCVGLLEEGGGFVRCGEPRGHGVAGLHCEACAAKAAAWLAERQKDAPPFFRMR